MEPPRIAGSWLQHGAWLAAAMVLSFVVGLVVLRVLLVRLPADWFVREPAPRSDMVRVARRIGGAALVLVGLALLVLPGPGMVLIAIGLALFDSPRKTALLAKLLARPGIARTLDRARARANKAPFVRP